MSRIAKARRADKARKALVNKIATIVVCVLAVPALGLVFAAAGAVLSVQ